MKLSTYINKSNLPASVVRAVVKKLGGWEEFKETAKDVNEHGADAGFSSFIYYSDTMRFYIKHRADINAMVTEQADQLGENLLTMVAGFRSLNGEYSEDEVGQTMYGAKHYVDTYIANALAWFALEEVCRDYEGASDY
jgi:hypothetical protein